MQMGDWKIRPTSGTSWQVVTPEGDVIQCVTGGWRSSSASSLRMTINGLLLGYGSDGRVQASEDFRLH